MLVVRPDPDPIRTTPRSAAGSGKACYAIRSVCEGTGNFFRQYTGPRCAGGRRRINNKPDELDMGQHHAGNLNTRINMRSAADVLKPDRRQMSLEGPHGLRQRDGAGSVITLESIRAQIILSREDWYQWRASGSVLKALTLSDNNDSSPKQTLLFLALLPD